jgi:cysteinyl-tRNA synthetase
MAEALLGDTIDIHGGGHDLVFPHHENERAQSTCAHNGHVFARYWLHNGFVTMNSEKMSKSLGNVLLVREMLKHAPGEAIRLGLLTGHYRQPLDWNDKTIPEARHKLDRLYGALREAGAVAPSDAKAPEAFVAALEDDLNTPAALAELFELVRALNKAESAEEKSRLAAQLRDAGDLLGLLHQSPQAWFALPSAHGEGAPQAAEIEDLIAQRATAKKEKNFKEADRIRDALKARGVLIEDSAQGVRWRYVDA